MLSAVAARALALVRGRVGPRVRLPHELLLLLPGIAAMLVTVHAAEVPPDTVVLLHGLGRTRCSMAWLAHELRKDGYAVINASYPSRTQPIETLAAEWLPAQLRGVAPHSRVHFVTHSMGGILLRVWLRDAGPPVFPGRVVMLAPPNAGSELTDRLAGFAPFGWFTGVNGRRLGTGATALPRALGAWPAAGPPLGIIAGGRSVNPLLGAALPPPHDGKVSVAATHLTGETAHLVLPFSHTWLAWRRETIGQVKAFLRAGRFAGPPGAGA